MASFWDLDPGFLYLPPHLERPGDQLCDEAAKNMQNSAYFVYPSFIIHSYILYLITYLVLILG